MTDFRALCEELVDDLEMSDWPYKLKEVFRADIARARAALEAQPEPQGPTDEELRAFYDSEDNDEYEWPWWHRIFRVLLTRYARPAIEPVPVAERLPGEEDCDAEGRCWMCGKVKGDWRLISTDNPGVPQLKYAFSHWLPHWALPVPAPANTINQED